MPQAHHPIGRILLATDLTARGDRATDRALELAKRWGARLNVLTVVDPIAPSDDEQRVTDAAVARARTALERGVAAQSALGAEIHVAVGAAEDAILDYARSSRADLIVTGLSGGDWFGQTLLGNTAKTLVRHARVPVLLVRRHGDQPYRRVIAATDLSEASRTAVEVAAQLFPESPPAIFLAYSRSFRGPTGSAASDGESAPEGIVAEVRESLAAWDFPGASEITILAEPGDAAKRLAEFAEAHDLDLIVAGTHGRTGILSILLGSVAERIVQTVPCDVMIVPSRGARVG